MELDFKVFVDGTLSTKPINWSVSSGSDYINLANNHVIGKKVGVATLIGKYIESGAKADIHLKVNVVAPEIRLTNQYQYDISRDTSISLVNEEIPTSVASVYLDNDIIGSINNKVITFNNSKLPKTGSELGKRELSIKYEDISVSLTVELCSLIIYSASDLDNMVNIAKVNDVRSQYADGYFALGSNIEYNKTFTSMFNAKELSAITSIDSKWYDGTLAGFKGVFDGHGYSINGVTMKPYEDISDVYSGGIFGVLSTGSVIRNVAFYNSRLNAETGFICSSGDGLIENVYIEYKCIGYNQNNRWSSNLKNATLRNYCGSFFTYGANGATGEHAAVRNCFIDASEAMVYEKFVSDSSSGAYIPSTYLVSNTNGNIEVNALCLYPEYYEVKNISTLYAYRDFETAFESEAKQFIDELDTNIWEVSANYLAFKSMFTKLSNTTISISASSSSVNKGDSVDLYVNFPSALFTYSLNNTSYGRIENNTFTASSYLSSSRSVKITVTSKLDSSNTSYIYIQISV